MAKRKPKRAKSTEQLQEESDQRKRLTLVAAGIPAFRVEGDKVHDFETNVKAIKVVYPFIVDRWFAEAGAGFDDPQRRAILWVQGLWGKAGTTRSTVALWDHIPGAASDDGASQQYALTELSVLKKKIPPHYWGAFEDVCRWNECPEEGTPAYDFHKHSVGMIGSLIALWNKF